MKSTTENSPAIQARSHALAQAQDEHIWRRTDRAFAGLMLMQWLGCIVLSLIVSPFAWTGTSAQLHPHVWAAILLGGAITALPVLLAWKSPGRAITRHVIAAGQMLMGALLIHLTGGRIETHFHVFGSLAFLAFYRDPRLLLTATIIVTVDHLARGLWWPQSIYGVLTPEFGRTLEHAGWVLFEDIVLWFSIREARRDAQGGAMQQAHLEALGTEFEQRVVARTQELQSSEARAHAVLETAYDPFVEMEADLRVCDWNARAAAVFGWSKTEVLGRRLIEVMIPEKFRAIGERAFSQALQSGSTPATSQRFEITAQRHTGEEFSAEVTLWSVNHGEALRLNAFIHDITERKQAAVAAATARDAAIESTRLKSEFLANMSHEIRTPMNGVTGMLNLLTDTVLTAEQRDFAETARASADSLLIVLNDILDFSKIEAGKLTMEETDFDLRELVERTLELLAGRAQEKGLELVGAIDQGTRTALRGDPTRLRQVLLNLVGNAIKFTERGEVVVRVRVEPDTQGILHTHFTVRDTGIGIASDVQGRLFQAFTQADGSTTRKFGGTGLGLAISRRLVQLMHGEIGVMSEPGRGSVFSFSVQLLPGEISAVAPKRANLVGRQVLIVDDNATNRAVLHHQLTGWGMHDTVASNGAEALQIMRAAAAAGTPFPLALLDLQMPGMDGIELARSIKADPALAGTRLVILTSLGAKIDESMRRSAGIDECLFKPVRQARLFDSMARSMAEAPAASRVPFPRNPAVAAPRHGSELRILLAEDNAVNQKVALGQLRKFGYTAVVAANGREALEAHLGEPFDVILMDCQMPEMEGYEASRRIRQHEAALNGSLGHPVFIIALTAHALEGDREKCLAAGMDDYLSKPVKANELGALLKRVALRLNPALPVAVIPDSSIP